MVTFDPVAKCKTVVRGADSVSQHPLLELDDWLQHPLILDLSGRDYNAAVHEVSDGVGQIFVSLGQEGLQTEYLSKREKQEALIHPHQTPELRTDSRKVVSLTQSAIKAPMARPLSL